MATRKLQVEILGDSSSLQKAFNNSSTSANRFGSSMAGAAKVAGLAAVAVGGALAVGLGKAIGAASDLSEQMNKANVVFGDSGKEVNEWAKGLVANFGISSRAALESAGTFGNMLVPMGFTRDAAADMSKRMVELAGDMSSFNNASPEDTLEALRAGLAGESEPLRKFGVFLSDARLKQEALNEGLYKGKGPLDANAKAAATYALILKDTRDAQGDFARTSSGLANSQRIVKAALENLSASIGGVFLPMVARAASSFAGLLTKLSQAQGIRAKIDVVIDFGKDVFESLKRQIIGGIVSVGVGPEMHTEFRNGLQQNLTTAIQGIDWVSVGKSMLEGFRKAFQTSVGAVDEVMGKISEAITRNRGKISEAGAVILVSIFTTLLDPAFWAKHWDLALSVAVVAFRGKLVGAAAKFLAPFAKLGGDMMLALVGSIERLSPRLAAALLAGLTRLGTVVSAVLGKLAGIASGALKALVDVVTGVFGRLGKIAVFAVKVLGIQVAIRAVVDFAKDVYNAMKGLVKTAGSAAADVGRAIVHGITSGIYEAGAGAIKAAAAWLASLIPGWMKKLLGIGSPSKVMADQVGKPMAEGVIGGLVNHLAGSHSRVAAGVQGVISTVTSEMRKLQGQLDAIAERQAVQDRARAVRDASEALAEARMSAATAIAEARKKGEGVAAAERAGHQSIRSAEESLEAARQAIVTAGMQKRLDKETAFFDKLSTAVEARKAKLAEVYSKLADFVGKGFADKTQFWIDKITAKWDKQIGAWQRMGESLTPAEQQLQDLDRSESARQRDQALAAAQASGDQEAIRQAQLAVQRAALEEQARLERAQRDSITQIAINSFERQKQEELAALNERRENLKVKLDEQLTLLQTKLAAHPAAYAKNQQAIVKLLNTFGIDYKNAGSGLGKSFAQGLDDAQDDVRKAARRLAQVADNNLHVRSPTKEGPMATLDTWWKKLPSTLASGLNTGPINSTVGAMATPAAAAGGVGGGGGSTTIQLVLDGRVISEIVRKDLMAVGRRNGSALGGLA